MDKNTGFTSLIDTLKQNKDVIADACDAGLEAAESIPFVGWALKLWNVKIHTKKESCTEIRKRFGKPRS